MTVYPNAKINLGLSVVSRRPDGYHNLETIFLPVPGLHDVIGVEKVVDGAPASFEQAGIVVNCAPEDNLIWRTYLRVRELYPEKVGAVSIRFKKQIPFGAGLGGGSADAAFMLRALNELFELGMSAEEMEMHIAPMGADCAFFIQNRPRMAEGIGNIFDEVPSALMDELSGKWLLLLKPDSAVSTREAYGGITPRQAEVPLREAVRQPIACWQRTVVNDFEKTVFPLHPEIADLKAKMLDSGALYAAMSGSGATVFGIFADRPTLTVPGIFAHLEQLK